MQNTWSVDHYPFHLNITQLKITYPFGLVQRKVLE